MERFLTSHPWLSTFIAISAINGLVYVIRGPNPAWANLGQALNQGNGSAAARGLFGVGFGSPSFPAGSPLHAAVQHPLQQRAANWANW